jgi:hypothetical protein
VVERESCSHLRLKCPRSCNARRHINLKIREVNIKVVDVEGIGEEDITIINGAMKDRKIFRKNPISIDTKTTIIRVALRAFFFLT